MVSTVDIITPPVDDPRVFGQIAAANSLSDIYAMGGRPLICLNLAGFPQGKLDESLLHEIVAGALEKITEAGAVLAGGHTTDDEEPKFGLAVTGLVHPDRYWSNAGASPGDAVLLTKTTGEWRAVQRQSQALGLPRSDAGLRRQSGHAQQDGSRGARALRAQRRHRRDRLRTGRTRR